MLQVDRDGKSTELGQRVVSFSLVDREVVISPNPVKSITKVSFPSNKYLKVSVFSADGSLVESQKISADQSVIELNLSSHIGGVCVLKLVGNGFVDFKKLIKK